MSLIDIARAIPLLAYGASVTTARAWMIRCAVCAGQGRSDGVGGHDALIAASALYLGEPLLTANDRPYRHIRDLDLRVFRP